MKAFEENNLIEFLDLLPEIIFEVDKELTVSFLNDSCKRILGYDKHTFINKTLPLEELVIPEDLSKIRRNLNNLFNGKATSGNSYRIYNSKKEIVTLEIYNSIIKNNGEINGIRSIAIDVSEKEAKQQKLSSKEKHYRLIYKNSPIPYQSLNLDGILLDINPAWESILSYSKDEVIGKEFVSLLHDDDKEKFKTYFLKFIEAGEINNIELRLIKKSNSIIYITFNGKIEYSKNRDFVRTHCVFNDITSQKLAEKTLLESESRLRELNATKDKFFSIIAHDLKNPFNDLMGFSQLLDLNIEKYDNTKIKQFVNIIHQSSKLAYNLLENLLDWSRSQTGTLEFKPEKFLLNEIISENIDLLGSNAKNKNIKIFTEIDEESYVFADKNMIRTVLRNLISNAIKYTNQGGYIKIAASKVNTIYKLSISDNGIGISEKNLSKIFQIDESYSTPGTEREKGTGLGLILCDEFIDKNMGTIWAESELEKGSTFHITLPTL
jgi:PAS domain S-box-containing protein